MFPMLKFGCTAPKCAKKGLKSLKTQSTYFHSTKGYAEYKQCIVYNVQTSSQTARVTAVNTALFVQSSTILSYFLLLDFCSL